LFVSSSIAATLEAVLARLPIVVTEAIEELPRNWKVGKVTDGKRLTAALGTRIRWSMRVQVDGTGTVGSGVALPANVVGKRAV
jgi:hypothetical protein